jgi:hypothetical protein
VAVPISWPEVCLTLSSCVNRWRDLTEQGSYGQPVASGR